jgi:RNA polymerase sigma factor (sigma-70 family)
MDRALPAEISALLAAEPDTAAFEAAWKVFVAAYSPLLTRTTRALGGNRDAAMDRYAWVIERLREDGCRRLRTFVPDGRSSFRTWLAVVARRLCYDFDRHRYGRVRGEGDAREDSRRRRGARQRLADVVGADVDLTVLEDPAAEDPEHLVRLRQRDGLLDKALAALPAEDRLVLRLRFDDDLSARQVAEIIGMPSPFHVYRRIDALLRRLRSDLELLGVHDPRP